MPCHVVLYQCLARSHHVTAYLAMSRWRLEFVRRLRSATQVSRCPWRERHPQLSTPHQPNTFPQHTCALVCCSVCDRSKRAALNTVNNTTMSTLHIRLILLPSSEAHARVLAQLMTTCHNRRLQRFCEGNGASVPHTVLPKIQFSEGAVYLVILRIKEAPLPARERLHAIPSCKSEPQSLHTRMSLQWCD